MQTILVAIKDPHKRRIVVQSVREVRPDANIREVATLEDIPQLVRVVRPEVLITTLDTQRHSTLRLLDDLHLQCPQVNSVVICGVDDFEIVRSAATRAGAVDFILAPLQLSDLSRVLQNIDVRIHALREAGAAMPLIARPEPSPEQREAERSFAEWITGGQSEAALEELCCGVPQGPSFLLCAQGEGQPGERAQHTEHLGEWFSSYLGAADCLLLARDEAHGRGSALRRPLLALHGAHRGGGGTAVQPARGLAPAASRARNALRQPPGAAAAFPRGRRRRALPGRGAARHGAGPGALRRVRAALRAQGLRAHGAAQRAQGLTLQAFPLPDRYKVKTGKEECA